MCVHLVEDRALAILIGMHQRANGISRSHIVLHGMEKVKKTKIRRPRPSRMLGSLNTMASVDDQAQVRDPSPNTSVFTLYLQRYLVQLADPSNCESSAAFAIMVSQVEQANQKAAIISLDHKCRCTFADSRGTSVLGGETREIAPY